MMMYSMVMMYIQYDEDDGDICVWCDDIQYDDVQYDDDDI